jgi:hypothetical protein
VDKIDLASADVIFHHLTIGGREQRLAGWTLEVTENFHHDGGILGTEGHMRIDVRNRGGLAGPYGEG